MTNNWKDTLESDAFRIKDGEVRPLLRDKEGLLFEPITPGSADDPFTFRPKDLESILYGLNKIVKELESGNVPLAAELALRCRTALMSLIEKERDDPS